MLEGLGLASKGLAPGDLPNSPNSHALRQAAVLQMQRTQGNQAVQRYLAQHRSNGGKPGPALSTPSLVGSNLPAAPPDKNDRPGRR